MNTTLALLLGLALMGSAANAGTHTLYIGTATGNGSEGIYKTEFDDQTGKLTEPTLMAEVPNPTFLAWLPDGRALVSVSETSSGTCEGFQVTEGKLTLTGTQSAHGNGPCHIAVDPSGKWAVLSNYGSGSFASYPVAGNGAPGEAVSRIQLAGNQPRAHSASFDPTGKWVVIADLGHDKLHVYALDTDTGQLTPATTPFAETAKGAGPRHTLFHPTRPFFYVANELNSTVSAYAWDANMGTLKELQTLDLMREGYTGRRSTADIHLSPDNRFLYVSNREDANTISCYSVDPNTGQLTLVEHHDCGGKHPRNFTLDPTGRFLLVANRNTDDIVVFSRNADTGKITPAGTTLSLSKPTCLVFKP
jgi:6-phosphogluconolactonase